MPFTEFSIDLSPIAFTRFKMQLLIWLTETETGDLDESGQLYRYQHFLPELVHDGKLSKKSLFATEDFLETRAGKGQDQSCSSDQSCLSGHSFGRQSEFVDNRLVILDEAQKMLLALENLAQQAYRLEELVAQLISPRRQRKIWFEAFCLKVLALNVVT